MDKNCWIALIARAVARPGTNALLIDESNHSNGWVSIPEAATRCQPFAVEVADDVLALDADSPERGVALEALAPELQSEGLAPVVIASGRPGHRHLFCRIPDVDVLTKWVVQARAARLDVRRMIRPPGAPHRLALPVALLEPADPEAVLAALSPRRVPARRRWRPLPPGIAHMLHTGRFKPRYASRSELLQGLALSAVNCGWTFQEFARSILGNRAGDKLRLLSEQAARRYLQRCWDNAVRRAADRPAWRDREEIDQHIVAIGAAARRHSWPGPGGASEFAVLRVHLITARGLGKLAYRLDHRTVAERAGLEVRTVSAVHRRLSATGWLRCDERGRAGSASLWTLILPTGGGTRMPIHVSQGGREENGHGCARARQDDVGHDLWRRRGLGKPAMRVWLALVEGDASSTSALSQRLARTRAAVRRQLVKLEKHGLAQRAAQGWRRGDVHPDDVARALVIDDSGRRLFGEGQRQRERHREDRRRHAHWSSLAHGPAQPRVPGVAGKEGSREQSLCSDLGRPTEHDGRAHP